MRSTDAVVTVTKQGGVQAGNALDVLLYVILYNNIDIVLWSQELDRVEEEAKVYKLVGPVLVKQDLTEARSNVQKRIDYINGEL